MPKKSKDSAEHAKKDKNEILQELLIQNFVQLQKVQTNLTEKIDKLTNNVSELLALFEGAARTFAEQPQVRSNEKDKEFLEKINTLMEQNKTIAKGLTLMEERIRERVYGDDNHKDQPHEEDLPLNPKPLPKF